MYSRISLGWQLRVAQILLSVVNLIAFALFVFKIDKLDGVIFILSASSLDDIPLFAMIISRFTTIAKGTSLLV